MSTPTTNQNTLINSVDNLNTTKSICQDTVLTASKLLLGCPIPLTLKVLDTTGGGVASFAIEMGKGESADTELNY